MRGAPGAKQEKNKFGEKNKNKENLIKQGEILGGVTVGKVRGAPGATGLRHERGGGVEVV